MIAPLKSPEKAPNNNVKILTTKNIQYPPQKNWWSCYKFGVRGWCHFCFMACFIWSMNGYNRATLVPYKYYRSRFVHKAFGVRKNPWKLSKCVVTRQQHCAS